MDPYTIAEKLYISTYAVEVCRHLIHIDIERCCGCKLDKTVECLMLSEKEKIELFFDEALGCVNFQKSNEKIMENMIEAFNLSAQTKTGLFSNP